MGQFTMVTIVDYDAVNPEESCTREDWQMGEIAHECFPRVPCEGEEITLGEHGVVGVVRYIQWMDTREVMKPFVEIEVTEEWDVDG